MTLGKASRFTPKTALSADVLNRVADTGKSRAVVGCIL